MKEIIPNLGIPLAIYIKIMYNYMRNQIMFKQLSNHCRQNKQVYQLGMHYQA